MQSLFKGRYTARYAQTKADLAAAQQLRWQSFIGDRQLGSEADAGAPPRAVMANGASLQHGTAPDAPAPQDADAFDLRCLHVLIETDTGRLVCCFRLLPLPDGRAIGTSYSAQYYDLTALSGFEQPMLEVGRFCMASDCHDPDVLRLAWAALTRLVDSRRVGMLFGCSSFNGDDWHAYSDSFGVLARGHLAPQRWSPQIKAPEVIRYAAKLAGYSVDERRALLQMPPLLRSYLTMGGWVSDHAVIDRQLRTLHVFTGLEIGAIPAARARALRLVAAG